MDTEAAWIRKIQRKACETSANALVSRYYKEMYSYTYRQTTNKQLSMDLTQDIFIHMLQSIGRYDGSRGMFRTWLYKLATNRIVDYYRSKYYSYARHTAPMEEDIQSNEDFTLEIEKKEQIEAVMQLVNQMDAVSQHIFRLKFFAEYTFADIAPLLNMPESTVKTKYYAMIRKLKHNLL
ncbi:RNA polymerase subunit sigma-70 [Paenibacillus sp. FSL H8-0548]|uniref:RNA polymerase sigma factor n=1 Tax=Paenibacillus sp. FSL H8-0548 TaxID=1920422 RepID=UPI00096C3746|nr:sigma-70 family RNA polymerase sigma factor [Paenibacillus sp. FSL H8-0548]OMF27592.1 RNA polymerase subunit sigma-70 [Paenibacillus sp. FSL H8-0548]